MLSSPLGGEGPALSAGRRKESSRYAQQAVERRAPGMLSRPSSGERPAFAAGR